MYHKFTNSIIVQFGTFRNMICLVMMLLIMNTSNAKNYKLYFYSVESNINNYRLLKIEFDTYLGIAGMYKFQPFKNKNAFEEYIRSHNDGIYLLSSWHFKKLKDSLNIKPELIGVLNNKSIQKQILISNRTIQNLDDLRNETIASASSEEYTKSILSKMFGIEKKELLETVRILTVPKDIDALMAVGIGIANSGLATQSSIETFKQINLNQYNSFNKLSQSENIPLPVIATAPKPNDDIKNLLNIIEKMGEVSDGSKAIKMLGLDDFKRVDLAETNLF